MRFATTAVLGWTVWELGHMCDHTPKNWSRKGQCGREERCGREDSVEERTVWKRGQCGREEHCGREDSVEERTVWKRGMDRAGDEDACDGI
eukprot:357723-Chlamydomonas_euryale.AAC.21